MMPDYMEALVSKIGVERILTDLLDVVIDSYVDEEQKKGKNCASYLYVLKNDLEVAIMRYKQRYILEDAKESIDEEDSKSELDCLVEAFKHIGVAHTVEKKVGYINVYVGGDTLFEFYEDGSVASLP